jgi:hypothetical protein
MFFAVFFAVFEHCCYCNSLRVFLALRASDNIFDDSFFLSNFLELCLFSSLIFHIFRVLSFLFSCSNFNFVWLYVIVRHPHKSYYFITLYRWDTAIVGFDLS